MLTKVAAIQIMIASLVHVLFGKLAVTIKNILLLNNENKFKTEIKIIIN